VPRTWAVAEYTGLFKEASSLDMLDAIRNDWKQPVLVSKEEHKKEFSVSPTYSIWRSGSSSNILQKAKKQRKAQDKSSVTLELKRKRVNNEEDLREELDKLRIELGNSKNHQRFLEDQLLKEEEMKASLDLQLKERDEQIVKLKKSQHEANQQLNEGKAKNDELVKKNDELVKKHVMVEHELASLKKGLEK